MFDAVGHGAVAEEVVETFFGGVFVGREFGVGVCEAPVLDPVGRDGFHVAARHIALEAFGVVFA